MGWNPWVAQSSIGFSFSSRDSPGTLEKVFPARLLATCRRKNFDHRGFGAGGSQLEERPIYRAKSLEWICPNPTQTRVPVMGGGG